MLVDINEMERRSRQHFGLLFLCKNIFLRVRATRMHSTDRVYGKTSVDPSVCSPYAAR